MKDQTTNNTYRGLPRILHGVRWTQHLLAIIAEVLILLSFAMSGMDVSLSGIMTNIGWLKWTWGAAFALGIDTSFVIAWVRVRQCVVTRNWIALFWNLLLAFGMSFIVFQPVAIQLLQQSLSISFNQALSALGINIVILVYVRAIVAVVLGAVLALTNVESAMNEQRASSTIRTSKRRLILFDKVLDKIAPVESISSEHLSEQETITSESTVANSIVNSEQSSEVQETIQESKPLSEQEAVTEKMPVVTIPANSKKPRKVIAVHSNGLASKRVHRILKASPDASLSDIAQKANVSRGYASQIRQQWLKEQASNNGQQEAIAQ